MSFFDPDGKDSIDINIILDDLKTRFNFKIMPKILIFSPDLDPKEYYAMSDRTNDSIIFPVEELYKMNTERSFEELYRTIYHEILHLNASFKENSVDKFSEIILRKNLGPYHKIIWEKDQEISISNHLYKKAKSIERIKIPSDFEQTRIKLKESLENN